MDNQYLASYLIANIFDLPIDKSWIKHISIPKETFGCFMTIYRKESTNHNDVHGCIGYWDKNFNSINKEFALSKLVNVSRSAIFEDNRSGKFPDILLDYGAIFEVSWLLLPIYNIDNSGNLENGEKFNNNTMGLIVQNGSSATYLPKVFKNISWKNITKSLRKKAGNTHNNLSFYSYFTTNISFRFYESFMTNPFCEPYIRFLSKFKKLPYQVIDNQVYFDENEWVRNMAVIEGIKKISCPNNLSYGYYIDKLNRNKKISRQALTSEINLLTDYSDKQEICDILYDQLNEMDHSFEQPQALIALIMNCKPPKQSIISSRLKQDKDIFRLNWDSQLLYYSLGVYPNLISYVNILDQQFLKYIKAFNEKTMSNELAVSFEGISSLLAIDPNIKSANYLIKIIFLLWNRWDSNTGLFKFLDQTMRIDITNHILNGQKFLEKVSLPFPPFL